MGLIDLYVNEYKIILVYCTFVYYSGGEFKNCILIKSKKPPYEY